MSKTTILVTVDLGGGVGVVATAVAGTWVQATVVAIAVVLCHLLILRRERTKAGPWTRVIALRAESDRALAELREQIELELIVVDWMQTYAHLLMSYEVITPRMTPHVRADGLEIRLMFREGVTLSDAQSVAQHCAGQLHQFLRARCPEGRPSASLREVVRSLPGYMAVLEVRLSQ